MRHCSRTARLRATGALAVSLAILGTLSATANAQTAKPNQNPVSDAQVQARVSALIQKMTLSEKIGQLNQLGTGFGMGGGQTEETIRKGECGSVLWVSGVDALNKYQKIAVEKSRLHIPLLYGLDVIHGFNTIFPIPLALAASWDTKLITRAQTVAAKEARAGGIHWTFSPMVDIARDPRWGRIMEGAGEDPYLGAAVARAQVRGFQGAYIGEPDHLLACVKHFAGYGAADGGRDYDSSYIPESQMWNVYLEPFRAAKEAGAGSFMSAYMDLNDVPATGNHFLLQEVLRDAWGFKGFVVSDAFSIQGMITHGFARDPQDAAYRAMTAGLNMDMASQTYSKNLTALVNQKRITVQQIEAAVRPILEMKIRLGLFEKPYADVKRIPQIANAPEHRRLARLAAQRSAVLLRNSNQLLPLRKEGSIAVIGPLGDDSANMISFWAGDAAYKDNVTILQGIKSKLGANAQVEFAQGVQLFKTYGSFFDTIMPRPKVAHWSEERARTEHDRAIEIARRADTVVMALGEKNPRAACREGRAAWQGELRRPRDRAAHGEERCARAGLRGGAARAGGRGVRARVP